MNAPDYMSRPEEQAKQPQALALCQRIAAAWPTESERGFVFNAAWAFWNFEHVWDDFIDGDMKPENHELAWKALYNFVDELLLNPFIRSHSHQMRSLMINAIGKAMDGDDMVKRGSQAELAPAVRCADIDVFRGFAELVGGWELMRELGKSWEYDQNKEDK